ncbi:MAG: DUF4410 domain-containing protein [Polyangiales bacterium]
MSRTALALGLTAIALASVACGGARTGSAAKNPDGSRIAIMVLTDENVPADAAPDRAAQINQLSSWMESDLLQILDGTGYQPLRVDEGGAPPGPGRYLLRVKIRNYNAGSKAARMLVGFGAGAAVLDTHFELVGSDGNVLVAGDPSVGTGRDWKNAARKVNLQTVDSINARLHQK